MDDKLYHRCSWRGRDMRHILGMLIVVGLFTITIRATSAGHVVLKNGLQIDGKPDAVAAVSPNIVPNLGGVAGLAPIVMIDAGMVRYFVRDLQLVDVNKDATLASEDVFRLKNSAGSRAAQLPTFVGAPVDVTEFDAEGRRKVTYNTTAGTKSYQQVITQIGPKYIKVSTVGLAWDFSLSTASIRPQRLDEMLRRVTDQQRPADRLTIARFYMQADRFVEALRELENIAKEFPEHADRTNEFALEARQQLAERLLKELENRRSRGQHRLAETVARQFPSDQLNAAALRKLRLFITECDEARDDSEKAIATLGELQGQIRSDEQREALEALRSEVAERLNFESLLRLKPFLRQVPDEARAVDEKLALAYSGWLLGPNNALDSLPKVLNLAKARWLILSYLRETDAQRRLQLLADITKLEGVGTASVLALIPNLPMPLDTPEATIGQPFTVEVSQAHSGVEMASSPIKYHVLLPQEYSPLHRYPLVVTLRSIGRRPDAALRWWGGNADDPLQAQRHGYIVIAPDYLEDNATGYGYGPMSHYAVLQSLRDARKRFNIDSDRIYLSGHAEGGDAAFDIGLSHPDEFAGVIPITGVVGDIPAKIRQNGRFTGLFAINGQLDRAISAPSGKKVNPNLGTINEMMMPLNQDVLYAEYVGRGNETYYGEIHRLFAWMEAHRRVPPQSFSMFSMRPNDNRFFGIKAHTISPAGKSPMMAQDKPTRISANIASGSAEATEITLTSTTNQYTVWLNPEIVSYEKRLRIKVGATHKFNKLIEPELETILEDLRLRGDRQRVFQTKIEIR